MSKPDNISQAIWDEVAALPIVSENFDDSDLAVIALALSQAYSRGLEDAARVADVTKTERTSYEKAEKDCADVDHEQVAILHGQAFIAGCIADLIRSLGSK